MLKLCFKHTSVQLRNEFNNGVNAVNSITDKDGNILLGGTLQQRAWLTGTETETIMLKFQSPEEILEEIKRDNPDYLYDIGINILEDCIFVVAGDCYKCKLDDFENLKDLMLEYNPRVDDLR